MRTSNRLLRSYKSRAIVIRFRSDSISQTVSESIGYERLPVTMIPASESLQAGLNASQFGIASNR
jgi:hypothetical protein